MRSKIVNAVKKGAQPVYQKDSLEQLIHHLKDKRVVMLGEATHGTSEFYSIRALITEVLVRQHGFQFVAVEGDWPDALRLHRYIHNIEGDGRASSSARDALFQIHRWPTWMWANEEVAGFGEKMKGSVMGFYGLDVYSLFESMDGVIRYLRDTHPFLARTVAARYACFDRFNRDEMAYARSLIQYPEGCEEKVVQNLKALLKLRISGIKEYDEQIFEAQQNARIVKNAESYYRSMLGGDELSWNLRDRHMMETLDLLLEREGAGAKAIVWAHNTHIGDYRATDMVTEGYVNLGGLAREKYGVEEVALIGFSTYSGEVVAAHAWGASEQVLPLPPARQESYESIFHEVALLTGLSSFFISLGEPERWGVLSEVLGHRAVGVVYDPRHEGRSNYVPTSLAHRYDAVIFVDQTSGVRSLHAPAAEHEIPETWPMGQ